MNNFMTLRDNPDRERDYNAASVITIEWHDIQMACKVIDNSVNPLIKVRTLRWIPFEDTIHPYPLAFEPPLIEHAVGKCNGFAHHWEKLNYAFALPNPADFPAITTLTEEDRKMLRRYAAVCRQLAGYSTLNEESGLTLHDVGGREPEVKLQFPTAEAFGGLSVAFRQLHQEGEAASFSRSAGRLVQAIKLLPEPQQDEPKNIVAQWSKARGKLMNQLLQTIVCIKVGKEDENPAPDNFPFSYRNVNPQKLILTFNYGDTIHFSGEEENLSTLLEKQQNAAYYKHAVLLAITNLSHLYFGFAVLAEAALAEDN